MARPCKICANPKSLSTAAGMIAGGATDEEVARAIGGLSYMSVSRHRKNHIEKPAAALARAADKGRAVAEQREQTVAAAEAGNIAAAYVGLASVVETLRGVGDRLERVAAGAEGSGSHLAVASLSSQQLRAAELRARIGGIGGYGAQKPGQAAGNQLVVNFNFSDRTERVACATIDGEPVAVVGPTTPVPDGVAIRLSRPAAHAVDEED